MSRLFIGNIPHASTPDDLQSWIESHGFEVDSVEFIKDRTTGNPRGFGFVTLAESVQPEKAIGILNGKLMGGRVLTVNRAVPLYGAGSETRGTRIA